MKARALKMIAVLCCLISLSLACTLILTPGQRLLTFQIESAGNVMYEGKQGVPDATPVAEMWDTLGDVSFASTATDDTTFDDGILEGNVVIRIKHVDKELATVSVKELKLRHTGAGNTWSLGSTDVQRIQEAESR